MSTLTFKSEEDRAKALDHISQQIPDVDKIEPGVDIDELGKKYEKELDEIMTAAIDAEAEEWKALEADDKKEGPKEGTPDVKPRESEPEPDVPNFEVENIRRTSAKMQADYEEALKKQQEDFKKYQEETEKKIADLKPKEDKPVIDPDLNRRIDEKSVELKQTIMDLNKIDGFDEEFVKLTNKERQIRLELDGLKEKKFQSIFEDSQKKIQAVKESEEKRQQQWEEDKKKEKERLEHEKKMEAAKSLATQTFSRVEKFREGIEDLKGGRSYEEMEGDYVKFSKNVASIFFDKSPEDVTPEERDSAFAKYLKKVPALIERLKASGLKEPEDLQKYIILSDINAIYTGQEFDYNEGTWKPVLNDQGVQIGMPSMKAAYNYYREKNGQNGQNSLKREKESIDSFKKSINQRTGVVELDQSFQRGGKEQLTAEAAQKIIDETSVDDITRIREKGKEANEIEKLVLGKFDEACILLHGEKF